MIYMRDITRTIGNILKNMYDYHDRITAVLILVFVLGTVIQSKELLYLSISLMSLQLISRLYIKCLSTLGEV
jgi:hypothetical protein